MNRRNFLKLLGLLVVPSSAIATLSASAPVRKGLIIITVELSKSSPEEQFMIDTGYSVTEWQDFYPTQWENNANSDAYSYGTDKDIIVRFSGGREIVIKPDFKEEFGEANLQIVKTHEAIDVTIDVFL